MNNGMTSGGIGAGELALLQGGGNNNWSNNPFAYLIWLVALGRNGIFGGGGTEAAAVSSQADAIRGVQESVNAGNLAGCQNTNAIQASINAAAAQAAQCCCDTRLEQSNQGSLTRQTIDQGNFGLQAALKDLGLQACQNTNLLSAQLAQCCCDNRLDSLRLQNEIDKTACATQSAINMQTMQVIQNQTANTQAILDRLNQQDINLKNDQIAELNQEIDRLRLDNSQQAQNNAIIAALGATANNIVSQITTICGCSCNGGGSVSPT